ncbi:MAG: histidine kinase, partial [Leptospiraceae bacterium]|nr:histidine kinase [Leptospiraceae bacterium]
YVFNTWFTWMLGDFIGIIIFTPLIVLIYNYVINIDSLSRLLFYSIAILFTFIVSLVIFFVARTWEINFIQYRINSDSKLIYNSILNNLHQQFNVIKLMGHYVSISENFTKEKFNYLADKNLKQSKAVIAFSWNQMITHKQRNLEENLLKKTIIMTKEFW